MKLNQKAPAVQENPLSSLLSTKQVALLLGCEEVTVRSWRRSKTGPPYIRLSERQVKYRREEVERWLEDRSVSA